MLVSGKRYFNSDQIFIGLFTDIIDKPEDLLRRICCFLNVKPIIIKKSYATPINVNPKIALPEDIKNNLYKIFIKEVEFLDSLLKTKTTNHSDKKRDLIYY